MKRLYDMNQRELAAEVESAQTRGDLQRVLDCQKQIALLDQIGAAFRRSSETQETNDGR